MKMNYKALGKMNLGQKKVDKLYVKGDKLYVKWKGYDNSFNRRIDEKDIV